MTLILITVKFMERYKNEENIKITIASIYEQEQKEEESKLEIDAQIQGYKVIGIIKIPKINLEYPILEETNTETLKLSITKFWGDKINQIGNVTLTGHNNLDGTMFGKLEKLENGDRIELVGIQKEKIEYEVFIKKVIDPNDISCIMPEEEGQREVTLITCINGNKNRLIIKARQIKEI
jgi:sortase A